MTRQLAGAEIFEYDSQQYTIEVYEDRHRLRASLYYAYCPELDLHASPQPLYRAALRRAQERIRRAVDEGKAKAQSEEA